MIFLLFRDWHILIAVLAFFMGGFCGFAAAAVCMIGGGSDAHLEEDRHSADDAIG